jgi:hypothetical protein
MKRYRKKRRLKGDVGFANKVTPPSGLHPCPPPPPRPRPHSPLEQREKGGKEKGGGGGSEGGERKVSERGSENERQGQVCGKDGAGREGGFR